MKLADWLKETGTTQAALAKGCGTTQGRISQLLKGDSPSFNLVRRISDFTGGAVTANDFLEPEGAAQ